jgi:hypothetical protein
MVTKMNRRLSVLFLFAVSGSLQLHAASQAPTDSAREPLTANQVRQLEKSAVTAADHRQLAAYYQFQAQEAAKKLADATELEKKWGASERATKTPDPYPHSRRLVSEYTAQLQKYSRLAEDHEWMAEKYDIAQRALKNGGSTNAAAISDNDVNQSSGGERNAFTLGPKAGPKK